MHVVGTAGHVDHGKSTLVRALTGIDPDRLQEEKDRGMTIDLGFAWLTLPGGEAISIVDVPGHERFIKNMLAGVGGIDLALLVIAADEGVMPQTVEHSDILRLLRIQRIVVVLTKVDLVDGEWLELVQSDVQDFLDRSGLPDLPIVHVSALTGQGLPDLVAAVEANLVGVPTRTEGNRPRVPIDRAFTIPGFGTIVTGTLLGGDLRAGQEVELVPGLVRARARSLQVHKQRVETASPGSRVAINIPGVATGDIARGMVLTDPGWLSPTGAADVDLHISRHSERPLPHGSSLTFHSGSAETEARVLLLQGESILPGERAWAQLRFLDAMPLVKGDLFILRTPDATIGGGEIIDPRARRHRRRDTGVAETLRVLREGTPDDIVLSEIEARGPIELDALATRASIERSEVVAIVNRLADKNKAIPLADQVVSRERWRQISVGILGRVEEFHARFPLREGMPRESARTSTGLTTRAYSAALACLVAERNIQDSDGWVKRVGFGVVLAPDAHALALRFIARIAASPFTPPSIGDLPPEDRPDPELARALATMGRIVLVSDDIAYTPEAFNSLRNRVVARLHENGKVTVADIRDQFGTSRKYVLALLEHLDRTHVTKRVGDDRVLA